MTDDALHGYGEAKSRLARSLRETSSLVGPSPLETALGNFADAAAQELKTTTMRHVLPPWEAFRLPVPGVTSSCQRPTLPERCYDASFGRVHVRPGCRC